MIRLLHVVYQSIPFLLGRLPSLFDCRPSEVPVGISARERIAEKPDNTIAVLRVEDTGLAILVSGLVVAAVADLLMMETCE